MIYKMVLNKFSKLLVWYITKIYNKKENIVELLMILIKNIFQVIVNNNKYMDKKFYSIFVIYIKQYKIEIN